MRWLAAQQRRGVTTAALLNAWPRLPTTRQSAGWLRAATDIVGRVRRATHGSSWVWEVLRVGVLGGVWGLTMALNPPALNLNAPGHGTQAVRDRGLRQGIAC